MEHKKEEDLKMFWIKSDSFFLRQSRSARVGERMLRLANAKWIFPTIGFNRWLQTFVQGDVFIELTTFSSRCFWSTGWTLGKNSFMLLVCIAEKKIKYWVEGQTHRTHRAIFIVKQMLPKNATFVEFRPYSYLLCRIIAQNTAWIGLKNGTS